MSWEALLSLLVGYRCDGATFNQYRDVHPELDRPDGAEMRLRNLQCYLQAFARPRFLLIGEAAGYAGCRFSGVAFTSESQLVGQGRLSWTLGQGLVRSSSAAAPWVERSATMVWRALGQRCDCLLWNAFPWHPMGGSGPLSNRRPGRELRAGLEVLQALLSTLPSAQPVAIGRVAQQCLSRLGVDAPYIRHPSHGGGARCQAGIAALDLAVDPSTLVPGLAGLGSSSCLQTESYGIMG